MSLGSVKKNTFPFDHLAISMTEDVRYMELYSHRATLMKRGTPSAFAQENTGLRVRRDAMMSKKELELVFEQLDKDSHFSGTILVSLDGEVLFERAYGLASR